MVFMAEERQEMDEKELFDDIAGMDEGDDRPSLVDRFRGFIQSLIQKLKAGGPMALVFLFLVGAIFGIAAKTLAREKVTVGYWDYTVSSQDVAAVNVNALEKQVADRARQAAEEAAKQIESGNTPPVPEPPTTPPTESGAQSE